MSYVIKLVVRVKSRVGHKLFSVFFLKIFFYLLWNKKQNTRLLQIIVI